MGPTISSWPFIQLNAEKPCSEMKKNGFY